MGGIILLTLDYLNLIVRLQIQYLREKKVKN